MWCTVGDRAGVTDRAAAGRLYTTRGVMWVSRRASRGEAINDTAAVLGPGCRTVNASAWRWGQALLDADNPSESHKRQLWGLMRPSVVVGDASTSGPHQRASLMSAQTGCLMLCRAEPPKHPHAGCWASPTTGLKACAGRPYIRRVPVNCQRLTGNRTRDSRLM